MRGTTPEIPEPLVIWEKIEIRTSQETDAGLYLGRIEDFVDNGIVIDQPELIKGSTLLRDNSEVLLHITRNDAIYRYSTIIQKQNNNGSVQYLLSNPTFINRVQRREFARVEYSTAIEYTLFDEYYKPNQDWFKSFSWNLSGNGVLMEVKDFVKKDSLLLLKINLFEELPIYLPVIGKSYRIVLENNVRLSGLGFKTSSETIRFKNTRITNTAVKYCSNFNLKAQEKLISFIFSEQIEQRKKGIL